MDRLTAMHRAVVCVAMPLLCVSRAPAADAQDPIAWSDVVASYAAVDDYTCLYHKEERAIEHGVRQTIRLSFRKPLDVWALLAYLDRTLPSRPEHRARTRAASSRGENGLTR